MKWHPIAFLCCCLAVTPLSGIDGHNENAIKTVEKKVSEKGITIMAVMPEESVAGSAVNLTIRVQNESKNEVFFLYMEKYTDYDDVKVLDSKGRPVPFTHFGKRFYGDRRFGRDGFSSLVLSKLAPGKHREDKLNLARAFDLSEAGEYTLSFSAEVAVEKKGVKLKIENLKFKVVDER